MRKNGIQILITMGLVLVVGLTTYSIKQRSDRSDVAKHRMNVEMNKTEQIGVIGMEDELKNKDAVQVVSGPITSVPWDNDSKFVKAIQDNDNLVLMAAYRTVLRDPLPGEEFNVHLAADMLAGIVVKPGETFSQNYRIGPYTEDRGFRKGPTYLGTKLATTIGGGVCKIASTLYNVSILSNLEIIERHFHSMPVPYVPYGQDATVAYGAKDFKFKNNTPYPVLIWAKGIDNILYMAFYGKYKAPSVEWHHETLDVQKAPKIYKINSQLPQGTEKVVLEGMDGATVKSWVTIKFTDRIVTERKLGISYYKPMPFMIDKAP